MRDEKNNFVAVWPNCVENNDITRCTPEKKDTFGTYVPKTTNKIANAAG